MKKLFIALAALAMVPALYAAEDTPIQNVCDSLSLGGTPVIELVPAYIDESNWYGNPRTGVKDSSNSTRHESYETVTVNISKDKTMRLPISIKAGCLEKRGLEVGYAKWTTSKTWSNDTEDDVATRIYTLRELSTDGHDATNTYNLLAFVPGKIPEDLAFTSSQLLYSVTFEFAFEYWFASASYQHKYRNADDPESTVRASTSYVTASGNDSLKVVNLVVEGLAAPDTITSIRIQTLKVVLVDSRKPLLPESSSSETPVASSSSEEPVEYSSSALSSSSSEQNSSSSSVPESSSSEEWSSSSEAPGPVSSADTESSSSGNIEESSSSEEIGSSSSEGMSSSSETPGPASSADTESSSSGDIEESSSSEETSSSSEEIESSSSEGAETSSSAADVSSSSEASARLVTTRSLGQPARIVQVRGLDGSVVKNSGKLAPGVYYVKNSDGKWTKMAVLSR